MFRRGPKPPLEYAQDFVEIAGEMARCYLHDESQPVTGELLEQFHDLREAFLRQYYAMGYIKRMLECRMLGIDPEHTDDRPDGWE